jgi:hypothetical protein
METTQGVKVMYLKKDVLNILTHQDYKVLEWNSESFWCLHARYRGELTFAQILSDYIFDNTKKRFNMSQVTANAVSHQLNLI